MLTFALCTIFFQNNSFRTGSIKLIGRQRQWYCKGLTLSCIQYLSIDIVTSSVKTFCIKVLRLTFTIIHTVNRKTHQNVFLIYSLQNLTDCDQIWYILSWVNLSYRNVNVYASSEQCLYPTLWNLAFAFCKWTAVRTVNQKHTKLFLSYLLQNEADSDKVWYVFLSKFAITWCQSQNVFSFSISEIKLNK